MLKYNCIIVEDEPLASEILEEYVQQVPYLHLVKVCTDAIFAMDVIQKENIDLIFLDIHLPKLKGLDFIKTLHEKHNIILTTAYHEYALEAYEYNVLDYLLKPIEFSRFLKAVSKMKISKKINDQVVLQPFERKSFFFNVNKKMVKIYFDEIIYIESLKEYIRIVTISSSIITKFQIGQIEEMLFINNFVRIHRSFIIAIDKIDAYTSTDIEIAGTSIPIGRSYKELVIQILEKNV